MAALAWKLFYKSQKHNKFRRGRQTFEKEGKKTRREEEKCFEKQILFFRKTRELCEFVC